MPIKLTRTATYEVAYGDDLIVVTFTKPRAPEALAIWSAWDDWLAGAFGGDKSKPEIGSNVEQAASGLQTVAQAAAQSILSVVAEVDGERDTVELVAGYTWGDMKQDERVDACLDNVDLLVTPFVQYVIEGATKSREGKLRTQRGG